MRNEALVRVLKLIEAMRGARLTLERLAILGGVSERTIRRDLEAMSASGVPVCCHPDEPDPDVESVYWVARARA